MLRGGAELLVSHSSMPFHKDEQTSKPMSAMIRSWHVIQAMRDVNENENGTYECKLRVRGRNNSDASIYRETKQQDAWRLRAPEEG